MSLTSRIQEISAQIDAKDLSLATRRILDLFLDYSLERSLKREAINLRAAYNHYAGLEKVDATEEALQALIKQSQDLLQKIEQALIHTKTEETENTQANPHTSTHFPQDVPHSTHKVVFSAHQLSKTFTSSNYSFRLPPVDLELRLGEITGIVGENGNGKTTLLRMIAGDLEADEGEFSYPLFSLLKEDWYEVRNQIAYIAQHVPKWAGYLKTNLHFTAAIHGLKGAENEEYTDFIIHRLGLSKYENAKWNEISGGYKLRFELARALVWRPKLLIIDEPLAHLDINAQQIFLQDLRFLANSSKHPMAVFISSQHLHEIESVSDNILFIKNGELLYNGKRKDFGSDRNENVFEIAVSQSALELSTALASFSDIHVSDSGNMKIIHTPLSVSSRDILTTLSQNNIDIQYFRDISNSTSKLFRETKN